MPKEKKKLPEFHKADDLQCSKCGSKRMTILYCSSCIPVDRNYIAGEHMHINCGVCRYQNDVMQTLDKTLADAGV